MATPIQYPTKEQLQDFPAVPANKKWTFEDANEVKEVVNNVNTEMLRIHKVANVTVPGSAIAFDFELATEGTFTITTNVGAEKTVALVQDANAKILNFIIPITNVAGVLNFGAGSAFKMADNRWDVSLKTFTPEQPGKYVGRAEYDGAEWLLRISNPPFPL